MKNSLGFYRFEYQNGFIQIKELISNEDYERYNQLVNKQSELFSKLNGKKREKDPVILSEMKLIKDELKEFSKPWFTIGSPMYLAIETGILSLPKTQGGDQPVKITKVDNCVNLEDEYMSDSDEI